MEKLLTIKQAAAQLQACPLTIKNWEKSGKIKPMYTPGGHRRYTQAMLDEAVK